MNRRGFTLIELLIVVVILGILAAIAIPKFSVAREKSMIATLETDLRNLSIHQEIYHARNNAYAPSLSTLGEIQESDGVTLVINEASGGGWAATAYHAGIPLRQCGIFIGTGDPSNASPATVEGAVECTP